jgi:hypothetical protein
LARNEIKTLMDPIRPAKAKGKTSGEDDGFAPPSASASASTSRNTHKPKLPDGVEEYFYPAAAGIRAEQLCYVPAMLQSASVNLDDAKKKISGRSLVTRVNEIDVENQKVNWDKAFDLPKDLDASKLGSGAEEGEVEYADLPSAAMKAKTYDQIEKAFVDHVYANHSIEVSYSPLLEAYSNPGETLDQFKARVTQTARELRDKAIEDLRAKVAKSSKSLEDKITKAMAKVDAQKAQASSAKLATAVSIGSSILGALFGRKSGLAGAASMVKGTTVTSASRAWRESQEAAAATQEMERLKMEYDALNKQCEDDVQKIRDQYDPTTLAVETQKLTPLKKNITATATGILWMPYERVGEDLRKAW